MLWTRGRVDMYKRKRRTSVVDLVIANTESFEEITDVKEGERTKNYFPPIGCGDRRETHRRERKKREE